MVEIPSHLLLELGDDQFRRGLSGQRSLRSPWVGTGSPRDLVEAARNYFELRLRHLQAIMDVNMAVTQLKMASGSLTR